MESDLEEDGFVPNFGEIGAVWMVVHDADYNSASELE